MTELTYDDGPELVPPAELLELRSHLSVAPRAEVRRAHLDAIVAQVRNRPRSAWGRVVGSAARSAAAVAVTLTVTTGLAAAQVLPEPAQKILSSVSERFTGLVDKPESDEQVEKAEPAPAKDDDTSIEPRTNRSTAEPVATTTAPSTAVPDLAPVVTAAVEPEPTTTTTTEPPPPTTTTTTTTTILSPTGPGSPDQEPPVTEPPAPVEQPTESPTEPTNPNEPTEPARPAQPTGGTVRAVDGGGTGQEGGPG